VAQTLRSRSFLLALGMRLAQARRDADPDPGAEREIYMREGERAGTYNVQVYEYTSTQRRNGSTNEAKNQAKGHGGRRARARALLALRALRLSAKY
jgi:hypothetical protein